MQFEAFPLREAVVIYRDPDFWDDETLIDEFAFSTLAPKGGGETKHFFAERYGGEGIGRNGGGGRCGISGEWCVKGIGPTPLLGQAGSFWYSHGGHPLIDALAEVVWSKWLDHALPYGSVRTPAVIQSGETVLRAPNGEHTPHPGALMVRETVMRLSTCLRASFYVPRPETGDTVLADVERVRRTVNDFMRILPVTVTKEVGAGTGKTAEYAAIEVIFHRIACQSAHACARQILHGALVESNIAIDARWFDLGTTTVLRNFYLAPSFTPTIWCEYLKPLQGLKDIIFYFKKYCRALQNFEPMEMLQEIFAAATKTYQHELAVQLAARLGLPSEITTNLPKGASLADLPNHVFRAAARLEPAGVAMAKGANINTIFHILGVSNDRETALNRLSAYRLKPEDLGPLFEANFILRDRVEAQAGELGFSPRSITIARQISSQKRNASFDKLSRQKLNEYLAELISELPTGDLRPAFASFLADSTRSARSVLKDTPLSALEFSLTALGQVTYDARLEVFHVNGRAPISLGDLPFIASEIEASAQAL